MATYFPSTNNQTDTAPMLYSRDHYPGSSESHVLTTNTTMYMNFSSSSGSYSDTLAVNSQSQTNYMDIEPLGPSDSNTSQVLLNFGGSRSIEPDFSRNDTLLMNPGDYGVPQCGPSQGLSLSLGTHVPSTMQISSLQYQNTHPNFCFEDEGNFHAKQSRDNDYMLSGVQLNNVDGRKGDMLQYGMSGDSRVVPNSKYLKAAQELLEEVVNVKKAFKKQHIKKELMKGDGAPDSSVPTESSKNELPAAEKQELQNKMTKLLSMLEEVDRRYRQYYHQMQTIVFSFDSMAGPGSAKLYTALALQTISRHFRCLRDAISNQIQLARKSLGEEDSSSLNDKGVGGISRLRYVDQQLKQQRALQQLGMMQQHAWRPQRGLPESSVSILRAWLFEHFLNPYPKDSDKIMLARQTGLTRSQVSNWFINARVRLWKPMVEEMYKEEAGDRENDSNSSSETTPKPVKTTETEAPYDQGEDNQNATTSTGPHFILNSDQTTSLEMMGSDANPSFQNLLNADPQSDRFMYHMSELERFGNGGGVSLTLGLQQGEGGGTLGMGDVTEHGFSLRDFYSSMKD